MQNRSQFPETADPADNRLGRDPDVRRESWGVNQAGMCCRRQAMSLPRGIGNAPADTGKQERWISLALLGKQERSLGESRTKQHGASGTY